MRKPTLVFGLLISVIAISFGITYLPALREASQEKQQNDAQQKRDLAKAKELLEQGRLEESLALIHAYKPEMESLSENGVIWLDLFIKSSEAAKDSPQLAVLFEFFPEIFKEHENASLLVADYYINNNQVKEYKKLRSLWSERETKVAAWYVLDVDQRLLEGRRQDAVDLLKARTFRDKADIGRLVRLALLYAEEDPKTAWIYLGEAYSKDPQNSDVRIYRAKLLETAGKYQLAHKEYQSAARLDPNNLYLKDQQADFYVRQKQYPLALNVWKDHFYPPSLDAMWTKALFWNKVTTPLDVNWEDIPTPKGKLEPLISYLLELSPDAFWNEDKFAHIPNNQSYLRTQQETYWLRLLSALQNKNELEAYKLLKYNPFLATSWNPELETALKRVLTYQMNGTLNIEDSLLPIAHILPESRQTAPLPPFFQELENLANQENKEGADNNIPEELHNLLKSNEAFSAVLIAADWYEAGLLLHQFPVIPNDFPDWVSINLTKAIDHNRSNLDALEFASLQKQTPELTLLTAELLIAGGDSDASLEKLTKLSKYDSEIGYRAAWLASLLYIEKKEWDHAKNAILSQPRIVKDTQGQEALARIAHLKGDIFLADKLYTSLESKSSEARSYLARRAFEQADWKRAKELTEKLLKEHPDNLTLQENLNKITEEMHKVNNKQA